jgi:hypothetical protein
VRLRIPRRILDSKIKTFGIDKHRFNPSKFRIREAGVMPSGLK